MRRKRPPKPKLIRPRSENEKKYGLKLPPEEGTHL